MNGKFDSDAFRGALILLGVPWVLLLMGTGFFDKFGNLIFWAIVGLIISIVSAIQLDESKLENTSLGIAALIGIGSAVYFSKHGYYNFQGNHSHIETLIGSAFWGIIGALSAGTACGGIVCGAIKLTQTTSHTNHSSSSSRTADYSQSGNKFAGTDYSKFRADRFSEQQQHTDSGNRRQSGFNENRKHQDDFAADFDFEEEAEKQSAKQQSQSQNNSSTATYGADKWHRDDIKFMNVINDPNASDAEREMAFKAMMRQQASRRKNV